MKLSAVIRFFISLDISLAQKIFKSLNDGRCFSTSAGALAVYASTDHLNCAYKCFKNASCGLFSLIQVNNTCLIYKTMSNVTYIATTTSTSYSCQTWVIRWVSDWSFIKIKFKFNTYVK